MKGQRYHRLDFIQIYNYNTVIARYFARLNFLKILLALMYTVIFLNSLVCFPNGAETGGLRSHDVNAAAVIHA